MFAASSYSSRRSATMDGNDATWFMLEDLGSYGAEQKKRTPSGPWPTALLRTDRAGFEPAVPLTRYAGLANRCLQPLGHLS